MSVKWVAGGASNILTSTIQWSPDGYNWYDASSGGFDSAYGVAYGNGHWVAVGSGDTPEKTIQWSPNGYTWFDASSGGFSYSGEGSSNLGTGVAYGNGWVAVGNGDTPEKTIQWSPNGRTWHDASSGGFINGNGVAYNGTDRWVAVGNGSSGRNSIQWSPDGRTWHDASSGGFDEGAYGVAYGGSKWVAVGRGTSDQNTIQWSPDGLSWYDVSGGGFDGGGGGYYGYGVAYGTDRWVAVGTGFSPENTILWSPNGLTWYDASNGFDDNFAGDVAYDGNRWIAVGNGTTYKKSILWSTDGRTWYDASSGGFIVGRGITSTLGPGPGPEPLPCFLQGTRILTPTGYKKVEHIKSGDLVCTSDNRNVKASLYRFTIESTTEETAPYTIQAGALGDFPFRDLHISGHHAIKDNTGAWQFPSFLTNKQVKQHPVGETVTYYHIECENYLKDNLVAEGVIAESYNRSKQTVWKRGATGYVRKQYVDTKDWWRASTCSRAPARTPFSAPVTRIPDPRGLPSRPAAN